MISLFSPFSDLITVESIEARLVAEGCLKVTEGDRYTCRWRAPNGRHFHAPNPGRYSMVPPDTLDSVLMRLDLVSKLSSAPTSNGDDDGNGPET